jgi:hypothetical protein
MKRLIKFIFIILLIGVVLYSPTYIFLILEGKNIVISRIADFTQRKVTISGFGVRLPLHLEVRNLNIEGLARVDSILISPSIIGFLMGDIAFNDIEFIRPELTYEKFATQIAEPVLSPEGASLTVVPAEAATATVTPPPAPTIVPPTAPPTAPAPAEVTPTPAPPQKAEPAAKQQLRLVLKRIIIKDGKINFIDHATCAEPIKINIKDISFYMDNLYLLPRSLVTHFRLQGRIPWKEGAKEGCIEADGWINLFKKDMQATVKIEGIDGIYLYPYYSKWVDLEKARIQEAKLSFISNIQGLNNNVIAECHLELNDIVFKPRAPEEQKEKAEKIAEVVLDMFKALNQGKIVLNFTVRTTMDSPAFGFGNIKMAVEDKLTPKKTEESTVENLLLLPIRLLKGVVKGTTDLSKSVIDGTFAVGNEVKKSIEEVFNKEKK